MKMIAGSCLRAIANSRLMRAAPRPANISTNDAADCAKNCAPDSCATAFAKSVLPVPGGPCRRMPFGTFAPSALNCLGSRRNSTISCSSPFASSTPAMSSQPTDWFDAGLICWGFTRGITFSVRHIKKISTGRTRSSPRSTTGTPISGCSTIDTCGVAAWICAAFATAARAATSTAAWCAAAALIEPPSGMRSARRWACAACTPVSLTAIRASLPPSMVPSQAVWAFNPKYATPNRGRTRREGQIPDIDPLIGAVHQRHRLEQRLVALGEEAIRHTLRKRLAEVARVGEAGQDHRHHLRARIVL